MPGQLTMAVKQARVDELEEINDRNTRRFIDYYLGREMEVLIEETDGEYLIGHTPEYVRVRLPLEKYGTECINTIVRCIGSEESLN